MVFRATQRELFVTGVDASRVNGAVVLVPKTTPVETGPTLSLCGKVSADRKSVTLQVNYSDTRVDGMVELIPVTTFITPVFEGGSQGKPVPFTQFLQVPRVDTLMIEKADVMIPSGGHMVIPGPTRTQHVRNEFGPPVLSRIPYLSRMFKNVGITRTTMQTYLIVSPRVLEVSSEPVPRR
jgi:hypothetical protein